MPSTWIRLRFGTIRNSTALKLRFFHSNSFFCFGTIRNSTALKQLTFNFIEFFCFGTIRNSTALKQLLHKSRNFLSFGTIRNSTALKPRRKFFLTKFRNRAIRPSRTSVRLIPLLLLLYHIFRVQEIVLIQYILRKIIDFSRFDK